MYKYGIPPGVDPVELRKKIDEISKSTDEILADPKFQEKLRRNARISGTLQYEDLNMQFTI